MIPDVNVKFDKASLDALNTTLQRYRDELGKDMNKVLVQASKNLAENLMLETGPLLNNQASNAPAARVAGEKAVERDIRKSIVSYKVAFKEEFKNKTLRRYVRQQDYTKLNEAFEKIPNFKGWTARTMSPEWHTLRVPRGSIYKNRANIREANNVTLQDKEWKDYLNKVKARVGYMKAGWGVSVKALGGRVNNWIARHLGYAKGFFKKDETGEHITIQMNNYTPSVKQFNHRYNYTLKKMIEKLNKDIEFQLDYLAKKFGKK